MLKATAWPYPVFDEVRYGIDAVRYGQILLRPAESTKGFVVDCGSLRDRSSGTISVKLTIATTAREIRSHVFDAGNVVAVKAGLRVLCKESKYRGLFEANSAGTVEAEIPLDRLRGVAHLDVLFLTCEDGEAANRVSLCAGSVVGIAPKPIILTLDEDWTGETISVDWLDFEASGLPKDAFIHVDLRGGSLVPKVWLNSKFKSQIETVLLRAGDNSPAALAGAAMREFIWQHVWEKVLLWAVKEESEDEENWPSTRIAKMWRERFAEFGWPLPATDNLDANGLNELSVRIQQCLLTAQNLSRVNGLLRFQPEERSAG